jgi:hypothetical protein
VDHIYERIIAARRASTRSPSHRKPHALFRLVALSSGLMCGILPFVGFTPASAQSPPAGGAATAPVTGAQGPIGQGTRLEPGWPKEPELVDLGWGVPGLRMYAPGELGPASQSLLLADAGLLGLVMPDNRDAFDELVARAGRDRPLVLIATALLPGPWNAVISFEQGDLGIEARHPFRLRLLSGDPETLGPEAPVVAVVLLPESFNLREPIRVRWGGVSAEVTFRR